MKHEKIVLALGVAGLAFAGYLSGVKLFTKTCAFNEECPIFLGLPACYFGFAMFFTITLFALLRVLGKCEHAKANTVILVTSFLGMVFAGYYTFWELPKLFREGLAAYVLGLPTCALGLIFYVIIFFLSYKLRHRVS